LLTARTACTWSSAMSRETTRTGWPSGSKKDGPGLPVDRRRSQGRHPQLLRSTSKAAEQPDDPRSAEDGPRERGRLAAAVAVRDDVGREQAEQYFAVALRGRGEEPPGELLLPLARGIEPRLLRIDLRSGAHSDLAAVVLGLADDTRDLVVSQGRPLVRLRGRRDERAPAMLQTTEALRPTASSNEIEAWRASSRVGSEPWTGSTLGLSPTRPACCGA
jgi:hypothetical protein